MFLLLHQGFGYAQNKDKESFDTTGLKGVLERTIEKRGDNPESRVKKTKVKKGGTDGFSGKLKSVLLLAELAESQSNLNNAIQHYEEVVKLVDSSGEGEYLNYKGLALIGKGEIHRQLGQYETSLQDLAKAVRLGENIKDTLLLSKAKTNIGNLFFNQDNYPQALQQYEEAMFYAKSINDELAIANLYNNKASVYYNLNQVDSVEALYREAVLLYGKLDEKLRLANTINNLGRLFLDRDQKDSAYAYFSKAQTIFSEAGNQKGMADVMLSKANLQLLSGNSEAALSEASSALEIAKSMGLRQIEQRSYLLLSTIYERLGLYQYALELYKRHVDLNENLITTEFADKLAEIQATLDAETKEREIEELKHQQALSEEQAARRNLISIGLALGILFSLLVVGLFYNRSRIKERANQALEDRNIEIMLQRDDIKEKSDSLQSAYFSIERKNREITSSIEYAKRIQEATLITKKEILSEFPNGFILFQPKDIVSGDFYWFGKQENKKILIAADCTGHGVPGAFMTMLGQNILNNYIATTSISHPGEVIFHVQKQVSQALHAARKEDLQAEDSIDMSVLLFEDDTVMFAGMKNPCLHYSTTEGMNIVRGNRTVLHIAGQQNPYHSTKLQAQRGDKLYLFSDGFPDQFGGQHGRKFMVKRFREKLAATANLSMQDQEKELEVTLQNWRGGTPQTDDIIVIGIEV